MWRYFRLQSFLCNCCLPLETWEARSLSWLNDANYTGLPPSRIRLAGLALSVVVVIASAFTFFWLSRPQSASIASLSAGIHLPQGLLRTVSWRMASPACLRICVYFTQHSSGALPNLGQVRSDVGASSIRAGQSCSALQWDSLSLQQQCKLSS